MPQKKPGDAAGFTTLDEEMVSTRLSLALRILDEDSGKPPKFPVAVRIIERNLRPVRNPGGYYLFFDLLPGTYTVSVEADSYQSKEEQIIIPLPDNIIPLPDKKYPFFEIKIKMNLL